MVGLRPGRSVTGRPTTADEIEAVVGRPAPMIMLKQISALDEARPRRGHRRPRAAGVGGPAWDLPARTVPDLMALAGKHLAAGAANAGSGPPAFLLKLAGAIPGDDPPAPAGDEPGVPLRAAQGGLRRFVLTFAAGRLKAILMEGHRYLRYFG